jgi:hypothetical protein
MQCQLKYELSNFSYYNKIATSLISSFPVQLNIVEKLRRWLFPIGGGAYGVKPLKPINPNERSSLSVHCGRFTINAGFRYFYRGLDRISC